MLPQKMVMTLKSLFHPNIMTLMKCITLKYLTKINHYPHSIETQVLGIRILMTFNISWVALKIFFNIIAISIKKKQNKKNVLLLNNLNLIDYSFEFTPVYATLLYIAKHLSYKCHNDLRIYKKNELKSTFIETVNPKKSNIVVGVIYRHPSINLIDFNCNYLIKLLENICKEQKFIFPLEDF